jgi:uncharacterized protein (DUF2252 family)
MESASSSRTTHVPHREPRERVEQGRTARRVTPRSAHADYRPIADRPDPIDLLEAQASTRVVELVSIRYGRMLTSPFAFFRGAALVMASDLATSPRSGFDVQLCGDAHLSNFGLFASPERSLVFDINDFDETLPGPWEWDVKRLAASLAVAGRENGYDDRNREAIVVACVAAYREHMRERAAMRELEVWYSHTLLDETRLPSGLDPKFELKVRRSAAKARSRDHLDAHARLTRLVGGKRRLISDPPLIVPIGELIGAAEARRHERRIDALIETYRQSLEPARRALVQRFRYAETARKVVGVGSVGTRAWISLLVGRDEDDPLVMQVKEAQPSVLEAYLGPSEYPNAGQRVVIGQRLMQAVSDILLGWFRVAGPDGFECDYYVRQLRDWKGGAIVEGMRPKVLADYGRARGRVLARAHARTGDRIAIATYLGKGDAFDRAIASFAEAYAEQNERDYAALRTAVEEGRVAATMGL